MNKASWDIFTAVDAPGSFWAGVQIARQLQSSGKRVRLFSDNLEHEFYRWAPETPEENPYRWDGIEVVDTTLAFFQAPAERVIQVWGARAPVAYLERLGPQGGAAVCFSLDAPNSDRVSLLPFTPQDEPTPWHELAVQMGSGPRHAGYIKPSFSIQRDHRLTDLFRHRMSLLTRMGLSTAAQRSSFFIMLSAETDFDPCPLVRMLRDTRRPTVLLVEPGAVQMMLACAFAVPIEGHGHIQIDQLTVIFLPDMTWAEQDECIAASDLVISSELSLCWRACCLGTPLVFGFMDRDQNPLLDWYCQGSISAPHVLLKNLSVKLLSYEDLAEAWHWYWSCLQDFEDHADEVRQRIFQGVDLVVALTEVGLTAGASPAAPMAVSALVAPALVGAGAVGPA